MTIEISQEAAIYAFIGGLIIGLAATLLLLFNGRIAGVAGIARRILIYGAEDRDWRLIFLAGLIIGGFVFEKFFPQSFIKESISPGWRLAPAALLTGIGVSWANGCTS